MSQSYNMGHCHLLKCNDANHAATTMVVEQRDGLVQVRCDVCARCSPETEIEVPQW